MYCFVYSKIVELEEELRVVGNNLKSLEVSEEKVSPRTILLCRKYVSVDILDYLCYVVCNKRKRHATKAKMAATDSKIKRVVLPIQ